MLPYLRAGAAVVSPTYRLSPEASAPAAVEDARHALQWIRRHGRDHGLDPERVVAIGPSAGGHLALMVGLGDAGAALDVGSSRPSPRLLGMIDLYGPTDVTELVTGPRERSWALRWIGDEPGKKERARRVSPVDLVTPDAPPTLIVHGDADDIVPHDQALRLEAALRAAGVPVEQLTLAGGQHGFFTPAEHARVEQTIRRFLERVGFFDADGASVGPKH